MLGYLVLVGALSKLLQLTPTNRPNGFVSMVYSVPFIFLFLLYLIGFPTTYYPCRHPKSLSVDALETVCLLILLAIHVVFIDNIFVPIALAAVGTVIVSVAQLRGSPRTSLDLSLAVIRISFRVALSVVILGYWLNTVAAIFPAIPSMLAVLLARQMPDIQVKHKQL